MRLQLFFLAIAVGITQVAPMATCSMPDCRCGTQPLVPPSNDAPSEGCCGEEPEGSETKGPSEHQDCDGSCLAKKPIQDAERSIQTSVVDSVTCLAPPVVELLRPKASKPANPHQSPYLSRASPNGRLLHLVFSTLLI